MRRCSPCLEKALLTSKNNGAMASDEWRAVPDIWRTSAEKYGDRVALVDPYHDPPTKLTYKEVSSVLLDSKFLVYMLFGWFCFDLWPCTK